MIFGKHKGDPTARRRRAPDEVLAAAQEVIRRHGAGESARSIARGLELSRTSVDRIIYEYKAAQEALESGDVDAELAALVSKYEGGSAPGFVLADADPVLVEKLVASGVDLDAEETLELLAAFTADPNALNKFRLGHAPKTAEWRSMRNKCGQLLTEEAQIKAKLAAGWRYRNFAWHPPTE
jgi:hypothetical protein